MMFGIRKKELFGNDIAPNCSYCRRNGGKPGEKPLCTLKLELKDGRCKRFQYDPLMREPRTAPPLKKDFDEEDFKL